jgi:hypothetical protein
MNRNTSIIVVTACLIKLCLHIIADSNSGFQGDEFLHIDAGNQLEFGYMEFPPLIGFLAYLQNLFGSTSILIHHFFSHFASIIFLIFVALTTIELGGKTKAVFISLLCVLAAPAFTRTHQLFQPVSFFHRFIHNISESGKRKGLLFFTGHVYSNCIWKYFVGKFNNRKKKVDDLSVSISAYHIGKYNDSLWYGCSTTQKIYCFCKT